MKVGVVFPQTEIGPDPGAVRAFAEAAEGLGYEHILAFDHVLGADVRQRPSWRGAYNHAHLFHEPFVLFGHLAAVTRSIGFVTGVLVLPQRQAALVAKQAAEVDVLSGGRLRLGVGVGWNDVEYEALGQNFHDRGARSEEQIALMRELWTREVVTFKGRWHTVSAAGINPLPVQRPIPVWIGAHADAALRRAARIADGLVLSSNDPPDERRLALLERVRRYAHEAGRDPASLGLDARANLRDGLDRALAEAERWRELGATHLSVNTMNAGLRTPDDHMAAIRRFRERLSAGFRSGKGSPS